MPLPILSPSEQKALRGLAQRLEPVVQVGKSGVSAALIKELDFALKRDELVKLRFHADRAAIIKQAQVLSDASQALLINQLGKTAVFYRPKPHQKSES